MRGTIERRGSSWRIRVDASPDPVSGRRRQITKTLKGNKRDAEQALARLLLDLGEGAHTGTDEVTVDALCRQWWEFARPNMEVTTAGEFAAVIRRYLQPRADVSSKHDLLQQGIGMIPLRKLRAWDLDRFYAQLLAGGGTGGRPLSAGTVRKVHTVLRLALGQAVRWQWLAENPALHASPPTAPRTVPKPPEPTEARRLIQAAEAEDPEWGTYLRVAAALGARRSEVCALRWSAIDLERAVVAIHNAIVVTADGVSERGYPKTASSRRRIALDPGTLAVLVGHRQRQVERAAQCGCELAPHAFVFSVEVDGSRPWNPQVVTHRFTRLRNRLGLPGVRLHDLRHYVATQLIAGGVDVRTVAGRLGHANPSVTLTTYAAWVPARDQDAAIFIGASLDGPDVAPAMKPRQ